MLFLADREYRSDFGYDFLRKRKFYKKVEENLSQLEEKYLLTELLDEPEFLEGQILCRVIQEMEHSMTDTVEQQIRKNGEFKRYIETWIHEIKIPIASTNSDFVQSPGRYGTENERADQKD